MTPERYQQVGQLCLDALRLEPDRRATFLDQACADSPSLRRQVESLLAYQQQAENFIELPALEVAARIIAGQQPSVLIGQQIGHYRVLSLLGAGGMGEVYLAQDERLSRKVALKLLPAQFTQDPDRVARFEREARTASSLNHPNVLTIYDIGQVDGRQFIVSEYIEGQTLRHRIGARMKLPEILDVAIQAASALAAAHEAKIVHRDIKPENIMVRRDGYIKVLDFGLAKLTEMLVPEQVSVADPESSSQKMITTNTGMVMGTVAYMSPEQALGQGVDQRTDIYSLGVVLYEMIAGVKPFTGNTPAAAFDAILHHVPVPLASLNPAVSAELERIINRALEKDREMRHQTASDLRAELKRLQRELDSGSTATVSDRQMPANSRSGWSRWKMNAVLVFGGLAVLMAVWFFGGRLRADLYSGATSKEPGATVQNAIGGQPSTGKLVGVRWSEEKYLFFRGGEYYRYDVKADRIDFEYPKPIAGSWQGIWAEGVDAIIMSPWDDRKAFFFKGREYIQYDIVADRSPDVGYPKPIAEDWPGIWPDGIDAAVVWNNGKIYFFKGSEYIRFDIQSKRPDPGYPNPIAGSWPEVWGGNFDTVFTNHLRPHGGKKVYFFKDGQYIRYDMKLNQKDPDYPRSISRNWIGLP